MCVFVFRSPQRSIREDARTTVSDQQVRAVLAQYPVDRYLVESSKKIETVNIIDDDIWNSEPALKPEDEIILRKLHEMLQSTADDLKLLSGELSKFHEPGVQVKSTPTPLDEEFNEKVHIEEVVNAKFHGHKVIDKSPSLHEFKLKSDVVGAIKSMVNNTKNKPKNNNAEPQVNNSSSYRKPTVNRNLGLSRTRIVQIKQTNQNSENEAKLNNGKVIKKSPAVAYNEFSYKYVEPEIIEMPKKDLHVQHMPSINIRSELKEQKVLHLDILPENNDTEEIINKNKNVAVITLQHDITPKHVKIMPTNNKDLVHSPQPDLNKPVRKVSKMSTCESSESTINVSSDVQAKLKTHKRPNTSIRFSPKTFDHIKRKTKVEKKEIEKRPHLNLDEWKKKLSSVYGPSKNSKPIPSTKSKSSTDKVSPKKSNLPSSSRCKQPKANNNTEYIPYSQLTLGGVRVSDIEKEILDIPNKNDIPLSPILDRILSSRENSFSQDNSRKSKKKVSSNVLTTSDENLLQEVIDIEMTISETLSKNLKIDNPAFKSQNVSTDSKENDSYADDFEEEKSDENKQPDEIPFDNNKTDNEGTLSSDDNESEHGTPDNSKTKIQDATFTKVLNLSFKNTVDVFEYVHSIDTQDTATQSNTSLKLPSETQTSPRNERPNIQPIHNDLWPAIDPKGEVERMFKLEKDFIKQLIIDEYGDLLEKNISKPSTSKANASDKGCNNSASQKNTQTSPAHVKSVMTSPTRTKTRMTSPFPSSKVDHQTSPIIFPANEEEYKIVIENDDDDLGISINLSSPRFSLRLPQTSREVISNLEDKPTKNTRDEMKFKTLRKPVSSSTSMDADNSSSELSSLGEVKLKLRRRLKKSRISSISESSSSSVVSRYSSDVSGAVLPLKSEGEISCGQIPKRVNRTGKSDGEISLGLK